MNPEDDPEVRIRELERPLNDVARATELGTGQYGASYPPPPMPPTAQIPPQGWYGGMAGGGYQPPFPPPQPSAGSRLWLIVAGVAVVLIAVVAGVVVYTANVFTTSFPFPSTPASPARASGGGGGFDTMPSMPGGTGTKPAPSVEPPVSGGQVSVSGIGETKAIECSETNVSISGVSNTITITGHCASLQVSGVSNVIALDSSGVINASGIKNRVTYHSGEPDINNSGSDNVVVQG
jgi:Protein of unknown function (DUF3060)